MVSSSTQDLTGRAVVVVIVVVEAVDVDYIMTTPLDYGIYEGGNNTSDSPCSIDNQISTETVTYLAPLLLPNSNNITDDEKYSGSFCDSSISQMFDNSNGDIQNVTWI